MDLSALLGTHLSTVLSLDQLLDEFRRDGHCEVGFRGEEVARFRKCCSRLDRVAAVANVGGLIGKALGGVLFPFVLLMNRVTLRNDQRVATAMDFYTIARGELKSVTGQVQEDGSVLVAFSS